ncbi:stromal cell-derived factor 2-like protein [Physcomitrium patens]|uniref:MIR domain-containing protein n=1 Tax=Physcomitrium patens TaxID=3218 RepID=A0A2K1K1T2_PHYPA|nr:stromal cell-derived factor 2-like protein [Physcomitrium patens]PNR47738.1 hypothetical protein PHYPA_012211 [Physcomitrium patens]|eukprot:XP_024384044.1 stromal cell-derived factor 2-like protein [Physcomitrella patens]
MGSDGEGPDVAAAPVDLTPTSPQSAVLSEESLNSERGVRSRPTAVARKRELEGFLREVAKSQAKVPRQDERHIRSRLVKSETPWYESLGFLQLACAMTLLSVALVAFLAIFHSSPPPVEAATEAKEVTHGSVIKLMHLRTKYRLHSHDVPYATGSGQQSVTAFPGVEDSNSYWRVQIVDEDHEHEQGDVISNGALVRLQHARTRKWLHSHEHRSPITGNLEVSAFGGDEQSDSGDYWKLEIEGKGSVWTLGQQVRFLHVATNGYLHSHNKKFSQLDQQEVCGVTRKNSDNLWTAAEGIYFLTKGGSIE